MPTRSIWPRFSRCERSESIGLGGASSPSINDGESGPTRAMRTTSASTSRSGPITPISRPAVFARIADERVGERQPDAIHRAGRRHAERHVADAAEILDGVEQAGADDLQARS